MPLPLIDGRPVVPVRLIPFVTGWDFSPDVLARVLAGGDSWHKAFLPSYQLLEGGAVAPVLPKEWDRLVAELDGLEAKLKAEERIEQENYLQWRTRAIAALPPATFVWWDDLEAAYAEVFSPERVTLLNERPGDRSLTREPLIDAAMRSVVYEGFPAAGELGAVPAAEPAAPPVVPAAAVAAPMLGGALASRAVAEAEGLAVAASENHFRRDGETWEVTYAGKSARLKHRNGLHYIAYLLQRPGRQVSAMELYRSIHPLPPEQTSGTEGPMDECWGSVPLTIGGTDDGDLVFSAEELAGLRRQLAELREREEDAEARHDTERALKHRAAREALQEHIAKGVGLRGRPRRVGSTVKRVTDTVSQAVRGEIRRLPAPLSALRAHLDQALHVGADCAYLPRTPTAWVIVGP